MALLRRKRRQDGSLGELEKVFDGETKEEKITRLESDNTKLKLALAETTGEHEVEINKLKLAIAELGTEG